VTVPVRGSDLRALASGESVVLFVAPGTAAPGDRIDLVAGLEDDPEGLAPAYRRWADRSPPGSWSAEVIEVHDVTAFDPAALQARHIRSATPPDGALAVLRVSGPRGPVLGDVAFAARLRSVHGALR
jgi:hypothetical protein